MLQLRVPAQAMLLDVGADPGASEKVTDICHPVMAAVTRGLDAVAAATDGVAVGGAMVGEDDVTDESAVADAEGGTVESAHDGTAGAVRPVSTTHSRKAPQRAFSPSFASRSVRHDIRILPKKFRI